MRKKEEILQDIERLKATSPNEGRECFKPLEQAVEEYFTPPEGLEKIVGECAYQVAYNYEYRNTIFAHQECMRKFGEEYPKGYEDVRAIFDGGGVWDELAEMPEDIFAAAFQCANPSVSDSDTGDATMINPYLDEWAARVSASREEIIPALETINDFCEKDATNHGLAVYFEEHGGIVSAPTHTEIAERVFATGGYAEVIHAYNLNDIHIPTYIDK